MKDYIVSAIVSVYNCEHFIRGCLEDLERQTIFDRLEIVVVNSGSQEYEEAIINGFVDKYDNIVYIKTDNRETIYQAWNRGIRAASGKYITNANADDRHRADAFEVMSDEMERDCSVDIVWADDIVTETVNDTFENHTATRHLNWPEFDSHLLLDRCFIGPHPMWRSKLHERFGYFDETLKVAGDYEYWLRISEACKFKHIKEHLGLYLKYPDSLENRNRTITILESERVRGRYVDRVLHDKKLLKAFYKRSCSQNYKLGSIYFDQGDLPSARKAFLSSIRANWLFYRSYYGLIACYLPLKLILLLRRNRLNS